MASLFLVISLNSKLTPEVQYNHKTLRKIKEVKDMINHKNISKNPHIHFYFPPAQVPQATTGIVGFSDATGTWPCWGDDQRVETLETLVVFSLTKFGSESNCRTLAAFSVKLQMIWLMTHEFDLTFCASKLPSWSYLIYDWCHILVK